MPEMTFGQMRAEAKTQGFEPIPIGTYNFRVENAELKKGTGSQQISTKIVIMDGPLAGRSTLNRLVPIKNDGDVNGMFFRQCKILGVGDDHPIWQQIDAVGLDQGIGLLAPLLIGGMFIGEIEIRAWMGEDRDNVKSMKPYGGVPTTAPIGGPPVEVPTGVPIAPVPPATAPLVAVPVPGAAPALVPVPEPAPETEVAAAAPAPTVVTQTPIPEPVPALVPQPVPPVTEVPVSAVSPEQPPVEQPTPVATPPMPVPVPVAPPTPLENEETEELATAVAVPIPPPPEDAPF